MVGVLIRMKLAVLRRSFGAGRSALAVIGATLGLALASGTLILSSRTFADPRTSSNVLCAAFAMWTLGWIVGPMVTGGDTTLRPQYFSLLTIPMRQLATGLFAAAFLGAAPVVTLVAFASLVLHGFKLGLVPGLVAIPAVLLQLGVVVLLSKLLSGGLTEIEKTRPGREVAALVLGFAVSFMILGPLALSVLGPRIVHPWPHSLELLVRRLPTGWATSAVDASFAGDWPVVLGGLAGLVVLGVLLLLGWANLLDRTLSPSGTTTVRAGRRAQPALLPANGFGAVIAKELRTCSRDMLRGRLVRMAFWTSVFFCLLTAIAHAGFLIAFMGLLVLVYMTMLAGNWYGADGTALWLSMMTPGSERTDVRGRQAAWALIAFGLSVVLSVAGELIAGNAWTLPFLLAGVPALLGGGAGLVAVFSVISPIVKADPHRRSGNPADTGVGGQVAQAQVLLYLSLVTAVPALGTVLAGTLAHSALTTWLGVGVGLLTGSLLAWFGGRFAYLRLRRHSPELLNKLRKGVTARAEKPAAEPLPDGVARRPRRSVFLWLTGGFLFLCQGLIPMVSIILGNTASGKFWYVALYLPHGVMAAVAVGFGLAGLCLLVVAFYETVWVRRRARRQVGVA